MPAPTRKVDTTKADEVAQAQEATEATLTPEQIQIRELQDQLAKAHAALLEKEDSAAEGIAVPGAARRISAEEAELRNARYTANSAALSLEPVDGSICIHFILDGFTDGETHYSADQEVTFLPGTPAYQFTLDRNGRSWATLTEGEQLNKYGKIFFRPGPSPKHTRLDDNLALLRAIADEKGIPLPTADQLARSEAEREARRRNPQQPMFGAGV